MMTPPILRICQQSHALDAAYSMVIHWRRFTDAAVAVVHAPAELGYAPLNEALVNFNATVGRLLSLGDLSPEEASDLHRVAEALFFNERTIERCIGAALPDTKRAAKVASAYEQHRPVPTSNIGSI
jgi:hypothetical protein